MPQYNRQAYKYQAAGAAKAIMILDDLGRPLARLDDVGRIVDAAGDLSKARFIEIAGKKLAIDSPSAIAQTLNTLNNANFNPNFIKNVSEVFEGISTSNQGMVRLDRPEGTVVGPPAPTAGTVSGGMSPGMQAMIASQPPAPPVAPVTSTGISQVPIRDVTPVVGSTQPLAFTPNLNPAFVAPSAAAGLTAVPFSAGAVPMGVDSLGLSSLPPIGTGSGYMPDSTALDSVATATPQADSTTRQIAEQGSTADPGMLESEGFLNFMYDLFGPYADVFLSTDFGGGLGSVLLGALGNRLLRGLTYKQGVDINRINKIRVNNGLPPITLKDFETALTAPGRKVGLRDMYSMLGLRDKDLGRLTQGKGVMEGGYNRLLNILPTFATRPFGFAFRPMSAMYKVATDTPVMSSQVAKQTAGRTRGKAGAVSEVKDENVIIPLGTNYYGSENYKELFRDIDGGETIHRLDGFLGEEYRYINSDIADDAGKIDFDKAQKFSLIDPKSFTMDASNARFMGGRARKDGGRDLIFKVDDVIQNPDGDNIPAFFRIFINSDGKVNTVSLEQSVNLFNFRDPATFNPRRNRGFNPIRPGGSLFSGVPERGSTPGMISTSQSIDLYANKDWIKNYYNGKKDFRERQVEQFRDIGQFMPEGEYKKLLKLGDEIQKIITDPDNPSSIFYREGIDFPKVIKRGKFTELLQFGGTAGEIRQMMDSYYPEIGSPVEDMFAVPLLV